MKRTILYSALALFALALIIGPVALVYADSPSDSACAATTSPCTQTSLLKRIANLLAGLSAESTTLGQTMSLVGCAAVTSPPTYGGGKTDAITCGADGKLYIRATGPTGSAVPSDAGYGGANSSGNLTGLIACDNYQRFNDSASGDLQLVALTSGKTIYICGYEMEASGTVTAQLEYGTGANCATGKTAITDGFDLVAQSGIVSRSPFYNGMKTAASNALCLNLGGAIKVAGGVYYTQF